MKRLAVVALTIFTFLVAPQLPGLRTASAAIIDPQPVKQSGPPDLETLFENEGPAAPEVICPKTGKCVPQYKLNDEVSEHSVKAAIDWIKAANEAGATALLIEFNTPGGSVFDGFDLAKAIEESNAPVTCGVDFLSASMGAFLVEACPTRVMTKRSMIMFHEPAGGVSGQPNQAQAGADLLRVMNRALAEHCAARMNISVKAFLAKIEGGRMWWLNWDEALKVHAIDKVVGSIKELHDQMLK